MTVSLQIVRFAVQFVGLIVLGRILAPSDFGLLVMVTAVIGVGEVIRDFGLSTAAVQAKSLSHGQASNLFWINTSIGLALTIVCALGAPILALVYDEPRLELVTIVLASSFLLSGLQTQFQAHITRSMRYGTLATTDLASQVVGFTAGITSAILGAGYWALVIQVLVQLLVLLALRGGLARWRPARPIRGENMRPLLRFGGNLVTTQILVYASSNIDAVLVGAQYGPTQLGYYKRAYQILSLPLNQIFAPLTNVALPVLSRLQDDRPRYMDFLRTAQTLVGLPTVYLFSVLVPAANGLIPLVLGQQWAPSAQLFQVMAIGGIFQAINYVAYWVFLSLGLTASHLRYSVLTRSLLISLLVVAVNFGPLAVAAAYSLGSALAWPVSLWWLRKNADLKVQVLLPGGARLVGLAAAAILSGLLSLQIADAPPLAEAAIGASVSISILIVAAICIPWHRRDFFVLVRVVRMVLNNRNSPNLNGNVGNG